MSDQNVARGAAAVIAGPMSIPGIVAGYVAEEAGERAGAAAGDAILENARIASEAGKRGLRAAGKELGKGAADGAKEGMSTIAKVLLGLLGLAVVGGIVWAVTQYSSGDKSAE